MRYISTLTLALFLSACGGSSSDSTDTTDTTDTTQTTNSSPIADAGNDQSVNTNSSVSLDASSSSDADSDSLTYDWAIVSFPSGSFAALDSTTVANPSFTADTAGSYIFQVAVSDGTDTVTDQVTIMATDTSTTTSTANGTSSTNGIECNYSYSAYNDSASVNTTSTSDWTCSDTTRDLVANGIPDHAVGTFPNDGNPNTIGEVDIDISYTLTPVETDTATELGGPAGAQGYVLNGVKIDASTAGSCDNSGDSCSLIDNSGNWSIEALGQSSFDFGTDDNNAHVQPDGTYHYHGMPEGFITLQGGDSTKMTLIAWAADGFPIYARYGYSDPEDSSSALVKMTGSYETIAATSTRPSTDTYPLGTFRQDWEYVEGSGDLDECNGRFAVTPEFPNGIYHYYATDSYPYFQRCVKGEVEGAGGPPAGEPPAGGPPTQ